MARNKKKKKHTQRQSAQLSPENYIRKKARNLPLKECYISADWESEGIANVFVTRAHKNGNKTIGVYLVDLKCLGVKDTVYLFNEPQSKLDEMVHGDWGVELVQCDYHLAHNIIYGAKKFAERYGFTPHKVWSISEHILEPDDERIPFIDIEFGEDGKPYYISGPDDDISFINRTLNTLNRTAGQGNYYFAVHSDDEDFSEIDLDEDELEYNEDDLDFDEEYFDEDPSAFEVIRAIALIYFQIFPDEEPKILPHEIIEDIIIDDEKNRSDLTDEDFNYIFDSIEELYQKSKASQKRGLEKLRDRYSNSPDLLLLIYLNWYEIYAEKPVQIEHLMEQKYPDSVGFALFKSYDLTMSGNPDKAWELLGKPLKIQEAFPDRESFTSDEFIWFLIVSLSYFTAVDDIVTAISYAGILINEIEGYEDTYALARYPLDDLFQKLEEKIAGVDISGIVDNPVASENRKNMKRL